jgi:hypothetical protein
MFDSDGRNMFTGSTASAGSRISVSNLGGEGAVGVIEPSRPGATSRVDIAEAQKSPRFGRGRMGCRYGVRYRSVRQLPTTVATDFMPRCSRIPGQR